MMRRGTERIQNNYLLVLFSQQTLYDLFIRHNMCQLFNSQKDRKTCQERRGIFCLPVQTWNELICALSFPWQIHPLLSPHLLLIFHGWCQAGLRVSFLWSYKVNDNQKHFPFGYDFSSDLHLERLSSALVSGANRSRRKQFTKKLLLLFKTLPVPFWLGKLLSNMAQCGIWLAKMVFQSLATISTHQKLPFTLLCCICKLTRRYWKRELPGPLPVFLSQATSLVSIQVLKHFTVG